MSAIEDAIAPNVKVMQIIVGSLMMGVLVFMVLSVTVLGDAFQLDQPKAPEQNNVEAQEASEELPIISYLGYAFGLSALGAFSLLGPIVRSNAIKSVPSPLDENLDKTLNAYQTGLIVSAAVCEGGAFFNLVAYMLEQQPGNLAAAFVLLIAMAILFPTPSRVANWIEDVTRLRHEQESFSN